MNERTTRPNRVGGPPLATLLVRFAQPNWFTKYGHREDTGDAMLYRKRIEPRAFAGANPDRVAVRLEHDGRTIGQVRSITVGADTGPVAVVELFDASAVRLLRAGKLGISPAYRAHDEQWSRSAHGPTNVIERATLTEIAFVEDPANPSNSYEFVGQVRSASRAGGDDQTTRALRLRFAGVA